MRAGHSKYKSLLLEKNNKCALCGINNHKYLIASHIKPWSKSDKSEKVDVDNGLLLCPHHDFLFDRGLITFDDNGKLIISSLLTKEEQILFNISENLKLELKPGLKSEQADYMRWHRENLFEGGEK